MHEPECTPRPPHPDAAQSQPQPSHPQASSGASPASCCGSPLASARRVGHNCASKAGFWGAISVHSYSIREGPLANSCAPPPTRLLHDTTLHCMYVLTQTAAKTCPSLRARRRLLRLSRRRPRQRSAASQSAAARTKSPAAAQCLRGGTRQGRRQFWGWPLAGASSCPAPCCGGCMPCPLCPAPPPGLTHTAKHHTHARQTREPPLYRAPAPHPRCRRLPAGALLPPGRTLLAPAGRTPGRPARPPRSPAGSCRHRHQMRRLTRRRRRRPPS